MIADSTDMKREAGERQVPVRPVQVTGQRSALPERDGGRADLPVIGPKDSPRSIARRLV